MVIFGSWILYLNLDSVVPVLRVFLVETYKQDFLFSFNEKQHQVITFRHLDVIISEVALARKYSRASRKKQTKEKMLYLVKIKIPKVISKDLRSLRRKSMEEVSAFHQQCTYYPPSAGNTRELGILLTLKSLILLHTDSHPPK